MEVEAWPNAGVGEVTVAVIESALELVLLLKTEGWVPRAMVVVPAAAGVKFVDALVEPAGMVMGLLVMVPTEVLELVIAIVAEPGPMAQVLILEQAV